MHYGRTNTYNFTKDGVKIVLLPNRDTVQSSPVRDITNLLTLARFEEEIVKLEMFFALIGREVATKEAIPEIAKPVMDGFNNIFPEELPDEMTPLCDIQHHIIAVLPNQG